MKDLPEPAADPAGPRALVRTFVLALSTGILFFVAGLDMRVPAFAHDAVSVDLKQEHADPSGAFSFRVPEGWSIERLRPELVEAAGDGVIVRFLHREEEVGLDSLHVSCMMERLGGPMDSDPNVTYEYDFNGGELGDMQALDSAFLVHYDPPKDGHKDWRQRNLTLVGHGHSLCVIAYCPAGVWKKSKPVRELLNRVVASVSLR
jgi:hypothetical protein